MDFVSFQLARCLFKEAIVSLITFSGASTFSIVVKSSLVPHQLIIFWKEELIRKSYLGRNCTYLKIHHATRNRLFTYGMHEAYLDNFSKIYGVRNDIKAVLLMKQNTYFFIFLFFCTETIKIS